MWSFNAAEMRVQSFSDCVKQLCTVESNSIKKIKDIMILRAPEYIIPKVAEARLSTHQAALSLLSTSYVITAVEPSISEGLKVISLFHFL